MDKNVLKIEWKEIKNNWIDLRLLSFLFIIILWNSKIPRLEIKEVLDEGHSTLKVASLKVSWRFFFICPSKKVVFALITIVVCMFQAYLELRVRSVVLIKSTFPTTMLLLWLLESDMRKLSLYFWMGLIICSIPLSIYNENLEL